MGTEEEGPDYDALWQRIVADAHAWQASWLEATAALSLSPDRIAASQRLSSRAFVRYTVQRVDLAESINTGDIAGYIERWYHPQETRNGPSISFASYDEIALDRSQDHVNPATLWRKLVASAREHTRRRSQASTPPVYELSTWVVGEGRVGHQSRLRNWARRLRGHR